MFFPFTLPLTQKKISTVTSGSKPSTMLTPLLTPAVALKTLDIFVR
jgi:hypothetical protein